MILPYLLTLKVGMAMVIPNTAHHIHFNNAGDSPSPPEVTNAIFQHLELESQLGGYHAAELTSLQHVYDSVARLIGAGCDKRDCADKCNARDEIALVESATVGWTRFFYGALETKERELLARAKSEKCTEKEELIILVSEAEYAANLVAAVKFARDHSLQSSRFRWRVIPIPSSTVKGGGGVCFSSGVVDLEAFKSILKGTHVTGGSGQQKLDPASIVMVCITHIPTNAGIINPVNEIGKIIDEFNSRAEGDKSNNTTLPQMIYLVDACQSVGQISVNVVDMKCHALAATGRKYLRGPRGTGFLYIHHKIANVLEPSHVDHAAAPVVRVIEQSAWLHGLEEDGGFGLCHTYQPGAARFEFWEANIATRLGLGAAIDISLCYGTDKIEKKCASLGGLLRQRLRAMEGVHVYHDGSSACGIVTFSLKKKDATAIKEIMQNGFYELDSENPEHHLFCFHLSTVPATSTPLDSSHTGLGDRRLIRASLSYFNTEGEIELLCKALEKVGT